MLSISRRISWRVRGMQQAKVQIKRLTNSVTYSRAESLGPLGSANNLHIPGQKLSD